MKHHKTGTVGWLHPASLAAAFLVSLPSKLRSLSTAFETYLDVISLLQTRQNKNQSPYPGYELDLTSLTAPHPHPLQLAPRWNVLLMSSRQISLSSGLCSNIAYSERPLLTIQNKIQSSLPSINPSLCTRLYLFIFYST